MNNKVLIKLMIPELSTSFDIFIPVNELVWKVKKLLVKSVSDLINMELNLNLGYELLNKDTGMMYKNNDIIINTDIRNGTELLLIVRNQL